MRFELTIGYGLDSDNQPISADVATMAIKRIITEATVSFNGVFATYGHGGWINPATGILIEENVLKLTIDVKDGILVDRLAEFCKKELKQSSVLVSQIPCVSHMV